MSLNSSLENLLEEAVNSDNSSGSNNLSLNNVMRISIFFGIICCVISIILITIYTKKEANIEVIETIKVDQEETKYIFVDVSGAVINPGIFRLANKTRISDALAAAGGLHEGAHKEWVQKKLNLAQVLNDGQKLYIPFEGEETGAVLAVTDEKTGLVNLNTASQEELESLPSIGPSTALKIISYREEHPFTTTADVMKIPGIGTATFEKIKDLVCVE